MSAEGEGGRKTLEARVAHLLFHGDDAEQLQTILLQCQQEEHRSIDSIEQQQEELRLAWGLGADADADAGVDAGAGAGADVGVGAGAEVEVGVVGVSRESRDSRVSTTPSGILGFPSRLVPGTDRTLLMACAKQGRILCLSLLLSLDQVGV
jgi:hypothetical protein